MEPRKQRKSVRDPFLKSSKRKEASKHSWKFKRCGLIAARHKHPVMLSDAALYQSASHPEKARLVFNTQLQQALKGIAKNREIVPVTPNATNTVRPVLSLHDLYGGGGSSSPFGRSTELNGWDLEKKMVALQEVRDLLQRPFFFYSDWATQAAATAKNAPTSLEKRMNYYSYFGKTLPLQLGQTTLLDLWYVRW